MQSGTMNPHLLTAEKPPEPNDPEYLEKKAAAAALFSSKDYAAAKAIYTELVLNPAHRTAVIYSNRAAANLKLDLPFSALHDAQQACVLSGGRWEKAVHRVADAAMALNMDELASRCYMAVGNHDKAQEALRRRQIFAQEIYRKHSDPVKQLCTELVSRGHQVPLPTDAQVNFADYVAKPQLPLKDPSSILQIITHLNSQHENIAVRDAPGMGRGVFATRPIQAGEVIFVEDPFVAAIVHGDRCQQCFRELVATPDFPHPPAAVTCGSCGVERYCSMDCQSRAWESYHRMQCEHSAGLKKLRDTCAQHGKTTSATVPAVVARLVGMTMCSPSWPCHTLSLGPMQMLSPHTGDFHTGANQLFQVFQLVADALGLHGNPRFDLEWFEAVYVVLINNVITIDREGDYYIGREGSKLGSGVYPMGSMLNHSCVPNAQYTAGLNHNSQHAHNALKVTAASDIKAGEQIFISYISTDQPFEYRNFQLKARGGFDCRCERCELEESMQQS